MSPQRLAALGVTAVVVAVLAAAVIVLDPPQLQRERRLDERRTSDLELLATLVDRYYEANKQLPPDLAAVLQGGAGADGVTDPETRAPYEYGPLEDRRYRLCAVFSSSAGQDGGYFRVAGGWNHPKGRYCFTRRAR